MLFKADLCRRQQLLLTINVHGTDSSEQNQVIAHLWIKEPQINYLPQHDELLFIEINHFNLELKKFQVTALTSLMF